MLAWYPLDPAVLFDLVDFLEQVLATLAFDIALEGIVKEVFRARRNLLLLNVAPLGEQIFFTLTLNEFKQLRSMAQGKAGPKIGQTVRVA